MKVDQKTGEIMQGVILQTSLSYLGVVAPPVSSISFTQPDMTLTLEELLDNHTRGLEVPYFPGQFTEEELYPVGLDVSEYETVLSLQRQHIENLIAQSEAESSQAENERNGQLVNSELNGGSPNE